MIKHIISTGVKRNINGLLISVISGNIKLPHNST